ncbi:MAG: DNA repair protein RecN [Oscillospiraceae bacterium]|nr:DNA repair protein RecN [Oscillospiraceae bacterium]
MIKLLHIENIAVVEKADIEFTAGLNVLTGETGAGKSIVIDALSAVTGGRASRDLIRTGAVFASVTAVFSGASGNEWLTQNGVESDDSDEVYITRRISADGKGVCRVNGVPTPATQLRELGAALLDIHGQNDGRKLLDEGAHLQYLDSFGDLADIISEYREAYKKLSEIKSEIEKLSMGEREKERRVSELSYQIEEIERARLRPGEQDELSERRVLLLNASKLTDGVETAFRAMHGGDSADGAVALISDAQEMLDRAATYSDGLRALSERLLDLRYTAQDIADELRDFRARLDFTPDELDELESRLDVLRRITRKYGGEKEALERLERGKTEISDIEDGAGRLAKLESELETCAQEATRLAEQLSRMRKAAAGTLEGVVMDELSQLNMPGVKFLVEFEAVRGDYGLCVSGCDEVRFLMSANAGEAPGRIGRIASGGELARIMLALKNVLSGAQDSWTMIFDEIDSGVSGIAAQRVGEKLAILAKQRQVLCVTHLPQIAAMADTHFEIRKSVSEGRTYTYVNELDYEGRKMEIARLSGGENITATTLKSAAEQLSAADKFKKATLG